MHCTIKISPESANLLVSVEPTSPRTRHPRFNSRFYLTVRDEHQINVSENCPQLVYRSDMILQSIAPILALPSEQNSIFFIPTSIM